MRKFKNKKIATLIIAFLMVFVVAGGFAALQRALYINARVNLFAPSIEVVWASAGVLEPGHHPLIWDGTSAPQGIGHPSILRFARRATAWPATDPVSLGATPAMFIGRGAPHNSAFWRLSHNGTGQHGAGLFPASGTITGRTLAAPREYIELEVNMVFDNWNQAYIFTATLGNPGDVSLTTLAPVVEPFHDGPPPDLSALPALPAVPVRPHVEDPGSPTPAEEAALAAWQLLVDARDEVVAERAAALGSYIAHNLVTRIEVSNLANVTIPAGTISAPVTFTFGTMATEPPFLAFLGTPVGNAFLDENFAVSVPASTTIRIPAIITPGA